MEVPYQVFELHHALMDEQGAEQLCLRATTEKRSGERDNEWIERIPSATLFQVCK